MENSYDDTEMETVNEEELAENQQVGANDGLLCDFTAYDLFHEGSTGQPCLSFDILQDDLGENRTTKSPVAVYFITGTQAEQSHVNNIFLMKISNLAKIIHDESDVESDEEGEDKDTQDAKKELPVISSVKIKHNGCVNRIRATTINNVSLAASWSEFGNVHIFDISCIKEAVNTTGKSTGKTFQQFDEETKPIFTFKGHHTEGFAIDWSRSMPGTLATGDCEKNIHVWKPNESSWIVDSRPYTAHTASVEDIQWSPNEPHVFASCSVDKSIRVWDERANPSKACMLTTENAHSSDVNVIHWNRNDPFIVSGGDDGKIQVWDLRQFKSGNAVATLKHHTAPVSTVEWHPVDSSVFASGGEDHRILQWDLAVERDPDLKVDGDDEKELPQQLLFVHQGQRDIKELHWHPQVPGLILSTAHSGFNIFKTISV